MSTIEKKATEYLKDYWLQAKTTGTGAGLEVNMDDLLAGAKAMGEKSLEHLMIDFYNYKIFPIIDI